jgi:hypothetical protein
MEGKNNRGPMSRSHDLAAQIRLFVTEHPEGWGHDDWLGFLHHLDQSGHEVGDPDGLGLALERERLLQVLERVDLRGLGPKRRESIASAFGTLHNLCSADPRQITGQTGLPKSLAEEIARTFG